MAGNRAGGLKAAEAIKKKYGNDFYSKIGHQGGVRCVPKGFATNHDLAVSAGRKGGRNSKRGLKRKKE